jgi:hypothetical protein
MMAAWWPTSAAAKAMPEVAAVVHPVALGAGKSFLAGLRQSLNLTFAHARTFENGSVVLWYAAKGTVHGPRT